MKDKFKKYHIFMLDTMTQRHTQHKRNVCEVLTRSSADKSSETANAFAFICECQKKMQSFIL